jgi:hypothetical protein
MWCLPVIPALGRLRQGDHEFQDGLGYTVRSYLKKKKSWVWWYMSVIPAPKRQMQKDYKSQATLWIT